MIRRRRTWLLTAMALVAVGLNVGCRQVADLTGTAVSTTAGSSQPGFAAGGSLAASPRSPSAPETSWLNQVDDRGRRSLPANRLCAEDAGRLLLCALAPLGRVEATFCPANDAARDPQRCQPSQLAEVETKDWIGWMLSAPEGRPKVLSILRGDDVLLEAFRAADASTGIVEVAVCPMDINGDGVNEVAVVHRSIAAPDTLLVDVIEFKPRVRHVSPASVRSPLADGEGCAAPALTTLTFNRATGALSIVPVATSTTTTSPTTTKRTSPKP